MGRGRVRREVRNWHNCAIAAGACQSKLVRLSRGAVPGRAYSLDEFMYARARMAYAARSFQFRLKAARIFSAGSTGLSNSGSPSPVRAKMTLAGQEGRGLEDAGEHNGLSGPIFVTVCRVQTKLSCFVPELDALRPGEMKKGEELCQFRNGALWRQVLQW